MSPKKPEVPSSVKKFIQGAHFEPNDFVYLQDCLKHTKIRPQILGRMFKNVYASPEFPNVTTDDKLVSLLIFKSLLSY